MHFYLLCLNCVSFFSKCINRQKFVLIIGVSIQVPYPQSPPSPSISCDYTDGKRRKKKKRRKRGGVSYFYTKHNFVKIVDNLTRYVGSLQNLIKFPYYEFDTFLNVNGVIIIFGFEYGNIKIRL